MGSGLATKLSTVTSFTATFWFYLKSNDRYSRLFDFGSSTCRSS